MGEIGLRNDDLKCLDVYSGWGLDNEERMMGKMSNSSESLFHFRLV